MATCTRAGAGSWRRPWGATGAAGAAGAAGAGAPPAAPCAGGSCSTVSPCIRALPSLLLTLHPNPYTPNPRFHILNLRFQTLSFKPSTLNPTPYTLAPDPCTPRPLPRTVRLGAERQVWHAAGGQRRSAGGRGVQRREPRGEEHGGRPVDHLHRQAGGAWGVRAIRAGGVVARVWASGFRV